MTRSKELEKHLRYEISLLKEENLKLGQSFQTISSEYSILKNSYNLIEKEKARHLEQNAIDKEDFKIRIKDINKENQNLKLEITKLREMIEIVNK